MTRTRDPLVFVCPHCGRIWDANGMSTARRSWQRGNVKTGGNTGFVAAASDSHTYGCLTKTPAERRLANARDEKRWLRSPPTACRIRNDPTHPGLNLMTRPSDWPATAERLQLLAAACAVTGLDHLPIVSRENAAPFAADLRSALSYIAELEAALEPFGVVGRLIDGPFGPGRVDDAATFKSGAAWRDRDGNAKTLTWGHFRRAAAALQKGADHGG